MKKIVKNFLFIFFYEILYYNKIRIEVFLKRYIIGPDIYSIILQKIPHNKIILKYLKNYGASIAKGTIIRRGLYIHNPSGLKKPFRNLKIGANSYVDKFIFFDLTDRIAIGDNTRISSGVKIYTHIADHFRDGSYVETKKKPVKIGDNSRVYPNSLITMGVVIKDEVIIGANSVVLSNRVLDSKTFYAGNPAKLINKIG